LERKTLQTTPPSQERVKIVLDPTGRPPITVESIEQVKTWLDHESRDVRDVVRSIGGAVISSSFMDSTLRAYVPYENSDAHIETIRAVPNVKDAYKDPLFRYDDEGWY